MPEHRPHPSLDEHRTPSGAPTQRTIVRAVVTELVLALEPVARDPFIDGTDDVTGLLPAGPDRWSRQRPLAVAR
jgi:hypothetical protein